MKWQDVRELFPDKWVLIEAIEAYTTEDRKRIVEQLSIIGAATDFFEVMAMYKQINKHAPRRELFVVHAQNEELEIKVRYRFLRITGPVTAVHAPHTAVTEITQLPNYKLRASALKKSGELSYAFQRRFQ